MKTLLFAGRTRIAAIVAVFVLSVIAVAGASASQGEDDAGNRVFGVTVSGDGSALPGVLISLSGGKVKQRTVSGSDGAFSFAAVPPGDYVVIFQFQGKKKVKRNVAVSTEDVDLGTIVLD